MEIIRIVLLQLMCLITSQIKGDICNEDRATRHGKVDLIRLDREKLNYMNKVAHTTILSFLQSDIQEVKDRLLNRVGCIDRHIAETNFVSPCLKCLTFREECSVFVLPPTYCNSSYYQMEGFCNFTAPENWCSVLTLETVNAMKAASNKICEIHRKYQPFFSSTSFIQMLQFDRNSFDIKTHQYTACVKLKLPKRRQTFQLGLNLDINISRGQSISKYDLLKAGTQIATEAWIKHFRGHGRNNNALDHTLVYIHRGTIRNSQALLTASSSSSLKATHDCVLKVFLFISLLFFVLNS